MNFLFHCFSGKLCNPADCHINLTDFIPCGKVHFTGLRQMKDVLECPYSILGSRAINAIHPYHRKRRIIPGNHIKLFLHLPDLISGRTDCESIARI